MSHFNFPKGIQKIYRKPTSINSTFMDYDAF